MLFRIQEFSVGSTKKILNFLLPKTHVFKKSVKVYSQQVRVMTNFKLASCDSLNIVFLMFGFIYVIFPQLIYLTRKVMLLAKFFIHYMATGVRLLYELVINISEDESE